MPGKIIGQNGAKGQDGTTRVSIALVSAAWLMERKIKYVSGQTQLISWLQSQVLPLSLGTRMGLIGHCSY